MQLSKEEYASKRIHNGSSVQIENSVTRVTVRHHEACQVMPNSYPFEGIFNQHLTTIKDSYHLFTVSTEQMGQITSIYRAAIRLIFTVYYIRRYRRIEDNKLSLRKCKLLHSCNQFEPRHDKTKKMSVPQQRLRSARASAQSDQSLRCPHEERWIS